MPRLRRTPLAEGVQVRMAGAAMTVDLRMNPDNPKDPLVWSIFDNAWVPLSYWKWVNGR